MSGHIKFTRPSGEEISRVRSALEALKADEQSLSNVVKLISREFGVYVIPEDLVFNVPGFRPQKTEEGVIEVPASLLNLTSLAELIIERKHRKQDVYLVDAELAFP